MGSSTRGAFYTLESASSLGTVDAVAPIRTVSGSITHSSLTRCVNDWSPASIPKPDDWRISDHAILLLELREETNGAGRPA
jgi:hypothetical protein